MNQAKMLCDISELNHIFRESVSVENVLQEIVTLVSKHMLTDVCSVYIYDDDNRELVLRANVGLDKTSIGTVKLALGEGLTGKSLKELKPIYLTNASADSDYKHFDGINEEPFETFLAMPILRGIQQIGVLVLQRRDVLPFADEEVMAVKAVASQLANIIENARFLMAMHQVHEKKATKKTELGLVKGKVASEGFAHGPIKILDKDKSFVMLKKRTYARKFSLKNFKQALGQTSNQLEELQKQVEEKLSDAASLIFASHLMILKDKEFVGTMEAMIKQGVNPPEAVLQVGQKYIDIFSVSNNIYVREKVQDVEDLVVRIIGNLIQEYDIVAEVNQKIVIAKDLFPSDLLKMSSENVRGIILVNGGVTSHISILAKSLQIPMIIANKPELAQLPDDTDMILDAETGNIYIKPGQEIVSQFLERNTTREAIEETKKHVLPETFTKDGIKIKLMANINLLSDMKTAHDLKCEGVGLYRTEFPFIIRNNFPSEEEQYFTYQKLIQGMKGKPVTFRTLDIGGDKVLSYFQNPLEQNPAIGMRSIRFSLENKEVFSQQIRAILRAGDGAEIGIMFPMISSIEEFEQCKDLVKKCISELQKRKEPHNKSPKIGMMVELPSVVELIEEFSEISDFFSVGTNDFIQFMLGVDRTNETVEKFYIPHQPAVLRALNKIVKIAHSKDKEVSVCGNMANNAGYIQFLIGIGIRSLSIDSSYIPRVQKRIMEMDIASAEKLASDVMAQSKSDSIAGLLGII